MPATGYPSKPTSPGENDPFTLWWWPGTVTVIDYISITGCVYVRDFGSLRGGPTGVLFSPISDIYPLGLDVTSDDLRRAFMLVLLAAWLSLDVSQPISIERIRQRFRAVYQSNDPGEIEVIGDGLVREWVYTDWSILAARARGLDIENHTPISLLLAREEEARRKKEEEEKRKGKESNQSRSSSSSSSSPSSYNSSSNGRVYSYSTRNSTSNTVIGMDGGTDTSGSTSSSKTGKTYGTPATVR